MPEFQFVLTPEEVCLIAGRYDLAAYAMYENGKLIVTDLSLADQIEVLVSAPDWQGRLMPTLVEVKAARITELTANCAAAIVGGYVSNALGTPHTYPSAITDQINMMGSVTASLLPGVDDAWSTSFWCADSSGEWAFRSHGVAEIQQAGADGKGHVVNCQATLEALTSSVMAGATAADVAAVVWPES